MILNLLHHVLNRTIWQSLRARKGSFKMNIKLFESIDWISLSFPAECGHFAEFNWQVG
jgi:hypothetical protein